MTPIVRRHMRGVDEPDVTVLSMLQHYSLAPEICSYWGIAPPKKDHSNSPPVNLMYATVTKHLREAKDVAAGDAKLCLACTGSTITFYRSTTSTSILMCHWK